MITKASTSFGPRLSARSGHAAPAQAAVAYAERGLLVAPVPATAPVEATGLRRQLPQAVRTALLGCGCGPLGCAVAGWAPEPCADPLQVARLWRGRPKIAVGLLTGIDAGLEVLDVPAELGAALLALARPGLGPVVETACGRFHFYVAPSGAGPCISVPRREGRGFAGIRWLGEGSFVLAPPFRGAGGGAARWHRTLDAPLPPALRVLDRLRAVEAAATVTPGKSGNGIPIHAAPAAVVPIGTALPGGAR
jgi:hypothetical protein